MAAAAADGVVPTKGEEGPGGAESGGEEKKPLPEFSLGFLSQTNPVRAVAINWIRSKWFNQSIIGLIVLNCIVLAMNSSNPDFDKSKLYDFTVYADIVFTALFTVEMVVRVIGMDFIWSEGSYLRDPWNVIDFFVVVLGWLAFHPSLGNYTAIRTVRVLRPLRTITGVEGMRVLVVTLLKSIPMLLDVLILCAFAFFIFGIVGVQSFAGALRNRCFSVVSIAPKPFDPLAWEPQLELDADLADGPDICSGPMVDGITFAPSAEEPFFAMSGAKNGTGLFNCPEGMVCAPHENPNFGITSFDNILYAWLTIFQAISLEGWTDIMYMCQDAVNPWVWIYFVAMIIFGSFFAVNLALAVLYLFFTEEDPADAEEEGEEAPAVEEKAADAGPVVDSNNPVIRLCQFLSYSARFDALTMSLIIVNTIVMAAEHYKEPTWQTDGGEVLNYILTLYFFFEMVIKQTGLGLREYFSDSMNTFDAIVVVCSLVEVGVSIGSGGGGGTLSVLRAFRLMRVFKLARSWKELNRIINTIFKSLASIAYLSLILLLFVFIFALLGMQFFGYRFAFCDFVDDSEYMCPPGQTDCPGHRNCFVKCEHGQVGTWLDVDGAKFNNQALCAQYPAGAGGECWKDSGVECWADVGYSTISRHNFDNIFTSTITIFQILAGENWNEVMYDGMRSSGQGASIYFLILFMVGNYIVLNLFLAILLDNFGGDDEDEDEEEEEKAEKAEKAPVEDPPKPADDGKVPTSPTINSFRDVDSPSKGSPRSGASSFSSLHAMSIKKQRDASVIVKSQSLPPMKGNSLFVLSPENPFRIKVAQIVCSKKFEYLIIALILVSSLMLAIDSPSVDPKSKLKEVLDVIDLVFVIIFTIEMVLKVIALGFVGEGGYLRNSWNVLDFLIVVIGILLQATKGNDSLASLKSLRTFRALRPIRMASRNEGMKIVVNALFQSIPPISNVLLVCLLFYMIFGILGVSLFSGKFQYCADGDGEMIDVRSILPKDQYGTLTREWCEKGTQTITWPEGITPYEIQTEWINDKTFDNIFRSLLALFEMASLEMWLDIMFFAVDSTGETTQPVFNNNPYICLFFVLFLIVGSFFVLNLFVGVTIDKFNEMKEKQDSRSILLTPEQERWRSIQMLLTNANPRESYVRPDNPSRAYVFDIVTTDKFDGIIMGAIMLSTLFMACEKVGASDAWNDMLWGANMVFTVIFLLEAIAKLFALGPPRYFRDGWNQFDFVVVCFSIVGVVMDVAVGAEVPVVGLLRILRVARIFRLIPKAKGLKTLFNTLVVSLPALVNVGSVLMLFFWIFAVMGMNLFGNVKYGEFLNRAANFRDFPSAVLVLFRMATGESWNGIMHDCMINRECIYVTRGEYKGQYFDPYVPELEGLVLDEDFENQCSPHSSAAIIYFIFFTLVCAFVMLNLVIAVILDNFQETTQSNDLSVSQESMTNFQEVWAKEDPLATGYISQNRLGPLVAKLEAPLGVKGEKGNIRRKVAVMSVDVPTRDGKVHFIETLHALAGRVAGTYLPEEEEAAILNKLVTKLPDEIENEDNLHTAGHIQAVLYFQAAVRGLLARHEHKILGQIEKRAPSPIPKVEDVKAEDAEPAPAPAEEEAPAAPAAEEEEAAPAEAAPAAEEASAAAEEGEAGGGDPPAPAEG